MCQHNVSTRRPQLSVLTCVFLCESLLTLLCLFLFLFELFRHYICLWECLHSVYHCGYTQSYKNDLKLQKVIEVCFCIYVDAYKCVSVHLCARVTLITHMAGCYGVLKKAPISSVSKRAGTHTFTQTHTTAPEYSMTSLDTTFKKRIDVQC